MATLNSNPIIYSNPSASSSSSSSSSTLSGDSLLSSLSIPDASVEREPWDSSEVFDLIRHVNDPEHPLTLEQLNVAQLNLVEVSDSKSLVKLNFTPTIPHCFTEDSQILTDRGFLFCSDFESSDTPLLVAAYDPNTLSFSFSPYELIIRPAGEHEMVEITAEHEFATEEWANQANLYGKQNEKLFDHRTKRRRRDPESSNLSSTGLSLLVTRDHNLFVSAQSGEWQVKGQNLHYEKLKASALLDGINKRVYNESKRIHELQVIQPNSRDVFNFRCAAAGGLVETKSEQFQLFLEELGLSDVQSAPFLEVYGYWLGDGDLQVVTSGAGQIRMRFSTMKFDVIDWLEQKFQALGLVKNSTYFKNHTNSETENYEIEIVDQRWINAFVTEYGGINKADSTDSNAADSKWFWCWVWRLIQTDARAIIAGLCRSALHSSQVDNAIYTDSIRFRDELVRLFLHAGYSPMFDLYKAGEDSAVEQFGSRFLPTADIWSVSYSDANSSYSSPTIIRSRDIIRARTHQGRVWCVSVPTGLIIARRAAVHDGAVTKASRPVVVGNCSMATLIGLSLRVKLLRSLPSRFKVEISITPGTHSSEAAINKQLNDKERVAAALENSSLLEVVQKCIAQTDPKIDIQW
jgi:hypothetical protein